MGMLFYYLGINQQISILGFYSIGTDMQYLPVNLNLEQQPVLMLGGGTVASRKIKALLKVHAQITCVALGFSDQIQDMAATGQIKTVIQDLTDIRVLDQYLPTRLIVSATDVASINLAAYHYAQQHHVWINTVDQQDMCDFITPAVVDRSPVLVSISSSGTAPVLARMIKQKIEYLLPQDLGFWAKTAGKLRKQIKQRIPEFNHRRRFWERFFQWSHRSRQVLPEDFSALDEQQSDAIINEVNTTEGMVSLVGAGPGNPELLTLKAVKVLQTADVVLHDHLISAEIMDMIRKDADLIDVGKQAGNHKTKQQRINELLVSEANKGLHVCRLKGGDSFVFGRGGEEVQCLDEHGIRYEIVPGITAAVGCAAYAGIPLTHRDHAQSLAFMTAHCSHSRDNIDWQFYAKENQTLTVYMGLMQAEHLVSKLVEHGKSPQEPVAVIENGTRTTQRTVTGRLHQLPAMIAEHQIKSPALIVIGAVAQYASQLDWYKPHTAHPESGQTDWIQVPKWQAQPWKKTATARNEKMNNNATQTPYSKSA